MLIVCHEKQPLASGCLPKKGYFYLFTQFLKFVSYKLYFRTDDYLYGIFARPDNACNACGFDLLLIHCRIILDLKTEPCDTVIDGSNVCLAAHAFEDQRRNLCIIVVCKNCALLSFLIVVLTSGSLQVKLCDRKSEYQIEYDKRRDTQRNDQPCLSRCRQGRGEQKVCRACGEAEACTETEQNSDRCENTV